MPVSDVANHGAVGAPGVEPIPRVFHQVWINRDRPALPSPYREYSERWRALHPHWQYRLWNLENLDFELRRPDLLPQCTHYAQMADVLRLEVLYRYGGVYLDTDFEPLRPIDPVTSGVGHLFCSEDGAHLSIGIIGARPGSPLIARLLDAMPSRLGEAPVNVETGPVFVTRQLLGAGFENDVRFAPSHLFYPYAWNEPHRADEDFPDALAVHRWAHSWADGAGALARWRRWWRRILNSVR